MGVLVWAALVVVGSFVTWAVIDAAGQQVLAGQDVPAVTATLEPAPAATTRAAPGPTASPTPRRHHHRHRHATAAPSAPAPTTASSPAPSQPVPAAPAHPRTSASPSPQPHRTPAVSRTWHGSSGTVTVSCTGRAGRLESATPADGYRVEIGSRGPGEVEVTFKAGETREVQVHAVCSGGSPRFSVEGSGSEPTHDD